MNLRQIAFSMLLALPAALPRDLVAQSMVSLSQGDAVRRAWSAVVAPLQRTVVTVDVDESSRALGTAVANNLVVTKYSELQLEDREADDPATLRCLVGEKPHGCQLIGFDRPSDLALLRLVDAVLEPAQWRDQAPSVGSFLATPDGTDIPCGIGVLSAAAYTHTRARAFLGIRFAGSGRGQAEIDEALENGAARAAGLRDGDVVISFDKTEIKAAQDLREQIGKKQPGDRVPVQVRRGDKTRKFEVVLGTDNNPRRSNQEGIWGELSRVRSGFQKVLQHDTTLEPEDMGGPVIDLDGRVLGVNIARAGRVETLALPAKTVRAVVKKLLQRER
ncbi:MAG: PDZ domain-containing protein [Planctomycetota bacterium]